MRSARGRDWIVDSNGDPSSNDTFTNLESALSSDNTDDDTHIPEAGHLRPRG